MEWDFTFFFQSIMLGIGLAMDAFSVSLANGLHEPCMKTRKLCGIAALFAVFQALMPMIGWFCVHTISEMFQSFEVLIPWIALLLLGYIGTTMLLDGIKGGDEPHCAAIGLMALLGQGIATSIDALSVGFTIAHYDLTSALLSCLLIALVTFIICAAGLVIGRKAGTKLAGNASIFGGAILIFIGLEIFITTLF